MIYFVLGMVVVGFLSYVAGYLWGWWFFHPLTKPLRKILGIPTTNDWKLVGEMQVTFEETGSVFSPGKKFTSNGTVCFYESSNNKRKIEILGLSSWEIKDAKKLLEPKIYKWRDHNGALPHGATSV